ncbi:MAG: hypothetical protein A2W90_03845 [Bacteroidetes bacterium GWF2_42_66]|nr:MAG: hypothetical protein A2W90_03845 [Bacteroidetes bacterium GWF2_42_66]
MPDSWRGHDKAMNYFAENQEPEHLIVVHIWRCLARASLRILWQKRVIKKIVFLSLLCIFEVMVFY